MALRANWKGCLKLSLVACARFDLSKFEDRYETALKTPPLLRPTNVVSLMDGLRRSVQAERRTSPSESGRSKAQTRAASRPAPLKRASATRRHAS